MTVLYIREVFLPNKVHVSDGLMLTVPPREPQPGVRHGLLFQQVNAITLVGKRVRGISKKVQPFANRM